MREKDPEKWKELCRERTRKHRKEVLYKKKQELQAILGSKCAHCGEVDPIVLEFDHIDPATKTMVISMSYNKPMEILVEEIKKCQLLCANCHKRKTWQSGGFSPKIREFRHKRSHFKSSFS